MKTGHEEKLKDLKFKLNTTPKWLGKFIYQNMYDKINEKHWECINSRTRLNLCKQHNPVKGLSEYSENNCNYCRLIKTRDLLEEKIVKAVNTLSIIESNKEHSKSMQIKRALAALSVLRGEKLENKENNNGTSDKASS